MDESGVATCVCLAHLNLAAYLIAMCGINVFLFFEKDPPFEGHGNPCSFSCVALEGGAAGEMD